MHKKSNTNIGYVLLFASLYSPITQRLNVNASRFTDSQLSQIQACAASSFCIGIAPIDLVIQLVDFCAEIPAECPVTQEQLAQVKDIRGSELPTKAPTTKPIDKEKNTTILSTNATPIPLKHNNEVWVCIHNFTTRSNTPA
jgi:hypothetical protein